MANRYSGEKIPEYQLVDTRFGSGDLKTHYACSALEKEMVCLFYKMGCDVKVVNREDGMTQIDFSRPEAKGKLLLQNEDSLVDERALNHCTFTYRVNITEYPSTPSQDYHVNRIADELVASLRGADPIRRAVADKR